MSNWFESSPARSVVIHTLVVAGAVWAVFAFVFDENKVAVFRAQAENERAATSQYKAKTEVLEVELARLRDENKRYQEWLVATPNTIPFFEGRIKALTDENSRLKQELTTSKSSAPGGVPPTTFGSRYLGSKSLSIGEAYIDPKTDAKIGIGRIGSDFTTSGTVSLPGQKPLELATIKPGSNWTFSSDGKRYQLTVSKIDWYTNKAEVLVKEIDAK